MKKIAITQRIIENESFPETRDALDVRWCEVFKKLNFLPVILPSHLDYNLFLKEFAVDGIILSGGNDLSVFTNDKNSVLRDRIEKDLIDLAVKKNIPLVGICRGMQLLTQHFGGKLKQMEGHVGHRHKITVSKDSKYFKELSDLDEVNSFHNFVVSEIPLNFFASATGEDGSIEAMEHMEHKVFGQMWHPERNEPVEQPDLKLLAKIFGD